MKGFIGVTLANAAGKLQRMRLNLNEIKTIEDKGKVVHITTYTFPSEVDALVVNESYDVIMGLMEQTQL